jgi:hypothetical protein
MDIKSLCRLILSCCFLRQMLTIQFNLNINLLLLIICFRLPSSLSFNPSNIVLYPFLMVFTSHSTSHNFDSWQETNSSIANVHHHLNKFNTLWVFTICFSKIQFNIIFQTALHVTMDSCFKICILYYFFPKLRSRGLLHLRDIWENKINTDKNIWMSINKIGTDIERENMAWKNKEQLKKLRIYMIKCEDKWRES